MTYASRAVASPRVVNIEDWGSVARRRPPKVIFDYIDGGAEGEVTLRENRRAFDAVTFRPRQAVPLSPATLGVRVLNSNLALPVVLAPVGYSRLMHPGGEVAAARAAGKAGTAYTLSTISGHRLEDVKAASSGPVWYQLYIVGGREAAEEAIARARVAGFSALVVTVDTPIGGMRERDIRNGTLELLNGPLLSKLPFVPQLLVHPGWLTRFLLDGGVPKLPNVVIPGKGAMSLEDARSALSRTAVTWADLSWIRDVWRGPILITGVLTGDDARRAVDEGAAGGGGANHGGGPDGGGARPRRGVAGTAAGRQSKSEGFVGGGRCRRDRLRKGP